MRLWQKTLSAVILVPVLAISGYLAYLWATYIDKTITSGTAYGFAIGASKQETLAAASRLSDYPHAALYVSYGPRAGDHFTVAPEPSQIGQLQQHDQWDILLDGDGKFFNTVRLTFRNGELTEVHRHRKHFELP